MRAVSLNGIRHECIKAVVEERDHFHVTLSGSYPALYIAAIAASGERRSRSRLTFLGPPDYRREAILHGENAVQNIFSVKEPPKLPIIPPS